MPFEPSRLSEKGASRQTALLSKRFLLFSKQVHSHSGDVLYAQIFCDRPMHGRRPCTLSIQSIAWPLVASSYLRAVSISLQFLRRCMHSIALSIQCGHSLIVAAAMFAFALAPGLAFVAPSVAVGWSRRSLSHCRRSGLSSTPRGTTLLSCSCSSSPL